MVVSSAGNGAVPVEFNVTAVDDRPEPAPLACYPPSGSVFPVGSTMVSCVARDLCRNTNTCVFQVTVTGEPVPTRCFDFNDGLVPAGANIFGNAQITSTNGVGDSGVLKLTRNINAQVGSFIIEDFSDGTNVTSISVGFKIRIGGGSRPDLHADGVSFVWANDLPDVAFGEELLGGLATYTDPSIIYPSGLIVCFDTWANTVDEAGPAVDVVYGGQLVARTNVPLGFLVTDAGFSSRFAPVSITVLSHGTLYVSYKDEMVIKGLPIPGFTGITGGRFGFGARTGAENDNHFVDDICITAGSTQPDCVLNIALTQADPPMVKLTWDCPGTLQWASEVDGPWYDIEDATNPYETSPAGSQKFYRLSIR